MVFTRKFSQFVQGGTIATGDEPVGLEAGANTIWDYIGGSIDSVTKIIEQDTSALTVGRWVRIDNTGLYVHGLANSAENAEIQGVVKEILSATQFVLQQSGYISSGTPGFNGFAFNNIYFLSDISLGEQTLTEPTTNGHVSKPVFAADSADSGWVICLNRGLIIGDPGPIPSSPSPGGDTNIHDVDQPGNTFMIGDWVRVSGDNTYALTNASTLAGAQGVGVVTNQGNPTFTIQFSGWNSATVTSAVDAGGLPIPIAAGTVYYLSDVVPGKITPTAPTAANTANKPAFISASAIDGTGWVLPQRPVQNASSSGGGIIQVQSTLVRSVDAVATTTATWTAVPSLATTITCSSTSSKVKISAQFQYGINVGGAGAPTRAFFRISRNGIVIPQSVSSAGGADPCTITYPANQGTGEVTILFVDEPSSVAALTYQIEFLARRGAAGTPITFLINAGNQIGSNSNGIAQMICEEIA